MYSMIERNVGLGQQNRKEIRPVVHCSRRYIVKSLTTIVRSRRYSGNNVRECVYDRAKLDAKTTKIERRPGNEGALPVTVYFSRA